MEWRDSVGDDAWQSVEKLKRELAEPNYLDCRSVGYLIDKQPDRVTLAMSLNAHGCGADFMTIPREAITSMRTLRR